jgi:hypothetical protein
MIETQVNVQATVTVSADSRQLRIERLTKLGLVTIFGVTTLIAAQYPINLGVLDYVLLVFVAARMGRLISFEKVFEPFRHSLVAIYPHPHEGDYTDPRYPDGWKHAVGDLISCTTCSSTWAIMALMNIGLVAFPLPTMRLIQIMAVVSGGELLQQLIEFFGWGGAAFRHETGKPYPRQGDKE